MTESEHALLYYPMMTIEQGNGACITSARIALGLCMAEVEHALS